MAQYSNEIKIPQERVAILIGKKGETKKELENITKTKMIIDSKEGDIFLSGDDAISLFHNNNQFNSLRSVHKMSESSYKTLEINNGILTPLSLLSDLKIDANAPRQSFPETYQANGYLDVLSTSFIIKNKEIHGKNILPFITEPAHELDSIEDFDYLEYLASSSKDIIMKLFQEK